MECFNIPEIKQLENVLDHCGGYGECDKCDFDWMEDHGIPCYRVCAKASITYIRALKESLDIFERKIDELTEVLKNG